MEVAAAVAGVTAVVDVTSKLANLSVTTCATARDLLIAQFGQVKINQELVKKSEILLQDLSLHSMNCQMFQDNFSNIDSKGAELAGEVLADTLTFGGPNAASTRRMFLDRFNCMLRCDESTLNVMEVKVNAPDEAKHTFTASFGYVASIRREEGKYDIVYAVHESELSVKTQKQVEQEKKHKLFGKTLKKTVEVVTVPFELSAQEIDTLTCGILRLKAMEEFQQSNLLKEIKFEENVHNSSDISASA